VSKTVVAFFAPSEQAKMSEQINAAHGVWIVIVGVEAGDSRADRGAYGCARSASIAALNAQQAWCGRAVGDSRRPSARSTSNPDTITRIQW
jgi:hypothetical protein